MTPDRLLQAAQRLLDEPDEATGGLWARSAALLIRQALERSMSDVLVERAPGAQAATFTSQLLVLPEVLGDRMLARRVGWTWVALSDACHADDMRLSATAEQLRGWRGVAVELAARVSEA